MQHRHSGAFNQTARHQDGTHVPQRAESAASEHGAGVDTASEPPEGGRGSYRHILKSTTIIGGSAVVNIALRVLRTKLTAVLVGPVGVGLLGTYISLADSMQTLVVLGLDSAGVKQIAESAGSKDKEKIARTLHSLRKAVQYLGVAGALAIVVMSVPLSNLTFGSDRYSNDIVLLSTVVLMMALTNGEVALIQGMQRIGDFARLNIWTAFWGTLVTVPILYFWGVRGVILALLSGCVLTYLTARRYARKVELPRVQLRASEVRVEVSPMLTLGVGVMASALMTKSTLYFLNVLVARRLGLAAVGLYQAANILSSIYVGFILDAMVKDYLPRLTRAGSDRATANRLVNEQIEIGILLAAPGIIATLTFAPTVIEYFYSREFVPAFAVLRWQTLGVLLQVGSWPIALLFQARGRAELLVATSFLTSVVYVGLLYGGIAAFGLVGTGVAFFGMTVFHTVATYVAARTLTGFRWSSANLWLASALAPVAAAVFISGLLLSYAHHLILGSTVSLVVGIYSLRRTLRFAGGPRVFTVAWSRIGKR